MRTLRLTLSTLVVIGTLLSIPTALMANEEPVNAHADDGMMGGEHKMHTQHLIGLKFISSAALSEGENLALWGAGIFYEREVIQDWLEIELNVPVIGDRDHVILPLDIVLKIPWHASPYVTPYVGVGPGLDVIFHEGETEVFGAIASVVGLYVWFDMVFGVDIEFSYSIVFEEGHIVHELIPSLGPVVHF